MQSQPKVLVLSVPDSIADADLIEARLAITQRVDRLFPQHQQVLFHSLWLSHNKREGLPMGVRDQLRKKKQQVLDNEFSCVMILGRRLTFVYEQFAEVFDMARSHGDYITVHNYADVGSQLWCHVQGLAGSQVELANRLPNLPEHKFVPEPLLLEKASNVVMLTEIRQRRLI